MIVPVGGGEGRRGGGGGERTSAKTGPDESRGMSVACECGEPLPYFRPGQSSRLNRLSRYKLIQQQQQQQQQFIQYFHMYTWHYRLNRAI